MGKSVCKHGKRETPSIKSRYDLGEGYYFLIKEEQIINSLVSVISEISGRVYNEDPSNFIPARAVAKLMYFRRNVLRFIDWEISIISSEVITWIEFSGRILLK